jgi:5,6-dimethylbenzimidazole synthase
MNHRLFNSVEQNILRDIMRLRRDVRGNRFLEKEVGDFQLDAILDAALMAPSVGFSQPWRFVIIREEHTKQQVAKVFHEENEKAIELFKDTKANLYTKLKLEGITEAPINIAVFYEASDTPVLGQTSMLEAGQYSTVCAIQNMWLTARALNLGMGWVSILDANKVSTILGANAKQSLVAYLCLGHVDTFYDRPELETLGWADAKSASDVVFCEKLS